MGGWLRSTVFQSESATSQIRTTDLITNPGMRWEGVPSICDLGGHRVGVLYPLVKNPSEKNSSIQVILSVFNWQSAELQNVASIVLRKYFMRREIWQREIRQCMYCHYDASIDCAVVSEGDIDWEQDIKSEMRIHQFGLTQAIEQATQNPDQVPDCIKQFDISSGFDLLGISAIHKDYADGTYFLMCSWQYSALDITTQAIDYPRRYADIQGMPLFPQEFNGFQNSFDPNIYFLALGNIVISIRFNNGVIEMVPDKQVIYPQESVQSVREVSPGLVAIGYQQSIGVDLFKDGEIIRSIRWSKPVASFGLASFGFVLSPDWDPVWSTEISQEPPYFIAMDDHYYVAIHEENAKHILDIQTGIGCCSYMPRYIARRTNDESKFALIVIRMMDYSKFDLVQLFLNRDCTLINEKEIGNLEIQKSRTILLNDD